MSRAITRRDTDAKIKGQLARKLAGLFIKNFAAYEAGASAEVKAGGASCTLK